MSCHCDDDTPTTTFTQAANGCITFVMTGGGLPVETATVCPGDVLECAAGGIKINGVLCPFPASHTPATVTSTDGTIVSVASGPGNQAFDLKVDVDALIGAICADAAAKDALYSCLTSGKAALSIKKTMSTPTPIVGVDFDYLIEVKNDGPGAANGAVITDNLPAGFVVTSTSWSGASTGTGSAPTFTTGVLPAHSSTMLKITGHFTAAGTFTNQASVAPPAGVVDSNMADNTTPPAGSPGAATTVVTAANSAPVANPASTNTAFNTAVVVPLLANDTDADGDPLTVTSATVPAAQGTISNVGSVYTFTPAAGFSGNATISYSISDGQGGTSSSTHTVVVGGATADLYIARTGHSPPFGNTNTVFSYSVTVSNPGPDAANGATLNAGWPTGFTIATTAWSTTGGATNGTGSGGSYTAGNLPSGSTATVTVTGTYATAGAYTLNAASVTPPAGVTDPITSNNTIAAGNTINVSAAVPPTVNLAVTATFMPTIQANAGDPVVLVLSVSNNGTVAATGAILHPYFNLTESIASAVWTYTGGASGGATFAVPASSLLPNNIPIANLPPGSSATLTLTGNGFGGVSSTRAGWASVTHTTAGADDTMSSDNSTLASFSPIAPPTTATTTVVALAAQAATALTGPANPFYYDLTISGANWSAGAVNLPANFVMTGETWSYTGGASGGGGGGAASYDYYVATLPASSTATVRIAGYFAANRTGVVTARPFISSYNKVNYTDPNPVFPSVTVTVS